MALNPTCNDPTDTFANIYYSRGSYVVFASNPFPIAELPAQLATVRNSGNVLVVVTSGLHGDTPYAADGFEAYMKAYGGGNPWPDSMGGQPVGDIDADGTRTCNPGPCPTGFHYDLDSNKCVADTPGTDPGNNPPPVNDPSDPRPDWPNDTISVEIDGHGVTFTVAAESTEVLKYLIRLWDLQHGITPPAKLRPPPGQPPPIVRPKPPGKCQTGYTYDPRLEMCVRNPVPPPPPPPPNGGGGDQGGLPTGPDNDGDEITNDLCRQLQGYFTALICAVQGMPSGTPADPNCCDDIVTAIGDVTRQLAAIAAKTIAPIQLLPIIDALEAIANAIDARPAAPAPADFSPVTAAIDRLAEAFAKGGTSTGPAVDLSEIIKQLTRRNDIEDVPQALIDKAAADGLIDADYAQMLKGAPPAWVTAVARWLNGKTWYQNWKRHEIESARADPLLGPGFEGVTEGTGPFAPGAGGFAKFIENVTKTLFMDGFEASDVIFQPFIDAMLGAHKAEISKLTNVKPGDEQSAAEKLLSEATAFGVAAHFAAVIGETIYPTKTLGFPQLAALVATLSGFDEVTKALIGPEMGALIAIPHRYAMNAQARSILPGLGQAFRMRARGLIDDPTRDQLVAWNGLHPEYQQAEQDAAFRGLNPRQMVRLIETNLFSQEEIADELSFAGIRLNSQTRMLRAAPYLGTQTYRTEVHSSLHAAYLAGVGTDQEYLAAIDAAETNTDRDSLMLQRAHIDRQIATIKGLESQYTIAFLGGVTDEATYRSLLAGLGLQDWKINELAGIADARAAATLARQAAAAERTLERQTTAAERKAALANFKSGTINAGEYAAALLATGLVPAQTAAWVDLATLQAGGNPVKLYGQVLAPADAQLLRQRVTALTDQRKKSLLTDSQFVDALTQLGIPATNINALRAAADAMITPVASAMLVPVQTK